MATEGQETLDKPSLSSLEKSVEDEELRALLVPELNDLPPIPRSAVESNFVRYYAVDFLKPAHDQYIYRHANGLCVIGLAPTHVALNEEGGVQSVDFNVGKSNRSEIKVTGKRKRNAQHLQPDSALCNVRANGTYYTTRCCVKGSLLEVNDRLIKNPGLLNSAMTTNGEHVHPSSHNSTSFPLVNWMLYAFVESHTIISPRSRMELYAWYSTERQIGKDILQ